VARFSAFHGKSPRSLSQGLDNYINTIVAVVSLFCQINSTFLSKAQKTVELILQKRESTLQTECLSGSKKSKIFDYT
jgi:hypothetical protein